MRREFAGVLRDRNAMTHACVRHADKFPMVNYWRGLVVQLVAYEVQYQVLALYRGQHERDNMDTATSNLMGVIAAVFAAKILAQADVYLKYGEDAKKSKCRDCAHGVMAGYVNMCVGIGLGRKSERTKLRLREKVQKHHHSQDLIQVEANEEGAALEIIVDAQKLEVWPILMPALYQLVPGSMVAKLWFNSIFPPPLHTTQEFTSVHNATNSTNGTNETSTAYANDGARDNVFSSLMVRRSPARSAASWMCTSSHSEDLWSLNGHAPAPRSHFAMLRHDVRRR